VDDIFVVKAAHDLDDGVGLADVSEKLVTEPFSLGRSADQAGDIDKFDRRGNYLFGFNDLCERLKTLVRDGDDADVWLDRGERIICGKSSLLRRECVKQSGLSNVGQANNSGLKHKLAFSQGETMLARPASK